MLARTTLMGVLAGTLLLSGCGNDATGAGDAGTGGAGGDRPQVVATTTQAADLARAVAGDRADVQGLLAPNADPHDHELSPRDAEALQSAQLVVRSGGELDAWAQDALAGSPAGEVDLSAELPAVREGDPHWWHDPRNAVAAVERLAEAMSAADPEGATAYAENARRQVGRIRALDAAVERCLGALPDDRRQLVTTHDALGYLLDRYELELVGSVIPSQSSLGQPSAGETSELVEAMRREGVDAIFPESSLDPGLEEAIAREAGVRVGDPLYADTLGPADGPAGTWLGAMAANARALADGLSGDAANCELPA